MCWTSNPRQVQQQQARQHEANFGQVQQAAQRWQALALSLQSSPSFANATPETRQRLHKAISHFRRAAGPL